MVVSNIEMRTLKAENGKDSMWIILAHGLGDLQKGIGLKFLNWDMTDGGNVRESRDFGGGLRKSYIFYLTTYPWRNSTTLYVMFGAQW